MKYLFFFFFVTIIFSCSDSGTGIGKQLAGSDSLVIHFNVPQTDSIDHTVTTTETVAINKLIGFVDSKKDSVQQCKYDGNLLFYKQGRLSGDVSFNYSVNGCRHFMISNKGELTATKMNNEAADFLKSLAEDKGWY